MPKKIGEMIPEELTNQSTTQTSLATSWTKSENGTEYKQDENGVRVYRIGHVDKIRPLKQFLDTDLAEQYRNACIGDFNTEFDNKLNKAKRYAKNYIKKYEQIKGMSKGYYFYSQQPGSGKTMLACCILNGLSKSHKLTTQVITAVDLFTRLKSTFDNEDVSKDAIVNPLLAVNVLLIDDLGSQKNTEWSEEILYHIIDSRLSRKKPTFFTSNYKLSELQLHQRIISRINAITAQIPMPEKDVRALISKKQEKEFLEKING